MRIRIPLIAILRTRSLIAGIIITALVGSIFLGISSVAGQTSGLFANSINNATQYKEIDYSIYYYNSSICILVLNKSSLKFLTNKGLNSSELLVSYDLKNKLNLGNTITISNKKYYLLVENNLPSIFNDCLIASSTINSTTFFGTGKYYMGYPNISNFVDVIVSSINELTSIWLLLGYISVAIFSLLYSYLVIKERQKDLRFMFEQGLKRSEFYKLFFIISLASSFSIILFSQVFSLAIQNISIGIINDLLGYVPLYSSLSFTLIPSLFYGLISFVVQISFYLTKHDI